MIADLRTSDPVMRSALERIDRLEAAQRNAKRVDGRRAVARTQCVTVSAIGQRSVTEGEKTASCLSGRNTVSSATTTLAVHSPGPVIGGNA